VSKNIPYFAFYPKDFIGDSKVQLMNAMERGAYISLLCVAWNERPSASLPDNDMMLARWSCLSIEEFQSHKEIIMAPFKLRDDGRWYQKRLESEAAKAGKVSETKRRAAKGRWEDVIDARAMHMDSTCNAHAVHMQCNSEPEPEPEPESEPEPEKEVLSVQPSNQDSKSSNSVSDKPKQTTHRVQLADEEFLSELRATGAYDGIDLDAELRKMRAWLLTPKGRGRKLTRQFVVNWLNKVDRPLRLENNPGRSPPKQARL
jgi:uncharacterized protein YdaU (DUF1376 family)